MTLVLTERARTLQEKRAELATIFEKHKRGDTYDMSEAVLTEVRSRNEELNKLTKEYEEAVELCEVARKNAEELQRMSRPIRPPFEGDPAGAEKGGSRKQRIGELFVKHAEFGKFQAGQIGAKMALPEFELKTLFERSTGWDPEDLRTGRVVMDEQEERNVLHIFPTTRTGMSTVVYMEETTFNNNAAETAEGGTYGEAGLAYTERNSEVRKIAVWLPVTDEQLEDVMRMEDWLNNRIRFMVQQRLALQVLVGNGTAPNLRGVNNVTGINTQAKGSDPVPDAIYKGMTQCRVEGFAEPDAVIMHPNDWQDVRLLRTADGIYIWGSPSDPAPDRIWGKPVYQTTHQTENQAVVGAFREHSELVIRRGVELEMTNSHGTHFVEGKKAIRCDIRVALLFYRALAFCTVTGI